MIDHSKEFLWNGASYPIQVLWSLAEFSFKLDLSGTEGALKNKGGSDTGKILGRGEFGGL